ncbi:MAG: F0F1 ATP synthase subunit A [Alphaproteobacteria bacterium]|nr:F0F1 ATP synthase subunit A [Alphaproteobacteria bacterium]MDE1985351.1 F0F1 ATP synthase subunit A [Alphaproteobacteria bacterium]MDE2162022.1 F0F1 ATP synthase subunit A [Alphaproteobacteria bacterium]MDE2499065.1 F0F1 ATP synthase subunit A [Alphaproteobacteria bacterium]
MSPMEQFEVRPIVPLHIGSYDVSFTNQALFMCIVVAAVSLFLTLAVSRGRLVPTRAQSMAEISYEFVANMIKSTTGDDGMVFFPFVFAIFMFVLFSNFMGLIPGAFTVTSQIAVTFALAAVVILTVVVVGFIRHGFGFLKLFVPKAPFLLLLLLVPIEIISFLTRLVSLSVRLFANMLAGHTMLQVFASFVVALGAAGGILSVLSITPMFMIVFIGALEMLVAFLQAYVFAILTCIYLNEALHLHEHH